jgi:hypothetical protein
MRARQALVGAIVVSGSLLVASCSSTPSSNNSTTTSSPVPTDAAPTSTTSSSAEVANVPISDQIRAQLVATGAALNNIPASEYTGLAPGLTYYALDNTTRTYWAGARLVPAPSSNPSSPTQAQISSQDAGSYYLFNRPESGNWTAYPAGNTGPSSSCPISVPAAVLRVWGWPAGSCRPSAT